MIINNVSAHGMSGAETVSGQIDDWDAQLEHHVQQQAQQVATQECDADASPTSCDVMAGTWSVELLLLGDEWDSGDLFVADSWKYRADDVRVSYKIDETDAMAQIRDRLEDALIPLVVDRTPFEDNMLNLQSVSWDNDRHSHFKFDL
jgi:hypothetical protein